MAGMRFSSALLCIPFLFSALSAQTPKAGTSPCSLVTKAEIEEAVGGPVSDGVANAHNKMVCDYKAGAAGTFNILLTSKAAGDKAERTVAELKKRGIQAELVPGFGESAYATRPGPGMQQLGVYKGSSHVIVTAMMFGKPDAKAKAVCQAIMRKALPRVP
jgi:hypothetical protein